MTMKRRLKSVSIPLLLLSLLLSALPTALSAQAGSAASSSSLPRILISTDIGGTDPDDNQSLAHFLMYCNQFRTEGIVSSPSFGTGSKQEILRMIDLYEKELPKLERHADGWPRPDELRAVTKQGRRGAAPYRGYDKPTEGSDWMVQCARRSADTPLYILVWGGLEDLAQALHDAPDIKDNIRVYWIGGPNKKWSLNSYIYIVTHFPDLWFIECNTSYRGFIFDNRNLDKYNAGYYEIYVRGAGWMGHDFGNYYKGNPKLGDTPSLLYMMDGDPADPAGESWGGSFEPCTHSPRAVFHRTTTAKDTVQVCSIMEFHVKGPVRNDLAVGTPCITMHIFDQAWDGYYLGNGDYMVRYSTYKTGTQAYTIVSDIPGFPSVKGEITVENVWPGRKRPTDYAVGKNWFTDKAAANHFWKSYQGAETVRKWREAVMEDWGRRWSWLKERDNRVGTPGQITAIGLRAEDARLSDGLELKNGAIHKWNSPRQSISWNVELSAGQYQLKMRYAEPYRGAVVAASIGGREVVAQLPSSGSWTKFREAALGVIRVEQDGKYTVALQGRQLSLAGHESREALPDLQQLKLIPVSLDATDEAAGDIPQRFEGKPIFDGRTLDGWEGNNGAESLKWFRVQDGAIVAGSMKENIPRNEFLRTSRKYSDFELRLKFKVKVKGDKGWNGGIQFRSIQHPTVPHEMSGYQADIIRKRWGGLYDESRRNCFLGTILSEQPCKPGEWNEYILRCEGARIRLWLNGQPVVDYTEPYAYVPHPQLGIIPQKGYIALQVHERGNPYEVWYKDIRLQELKTPTPVFEGYRSVGRLAGGTPTADSLGWKVGVQAYDFKRVATFFEAIDLTAAMGLKYIEGVGMRLSADTQEQFGPDMSDEWKARTRQKLIDSGVECSSYYRRITAQNAEQVFRFCQEMGLMLVTDPVRVPQGEGSMDFYEALAKKYQVRMVLTNHPEADGSPYYDPDTVLADLAGRDPLLGASVDIGHFMRDGRHPLPIVRKYAEAGRLYHFHFRDVEGLGTGSPDIRVGEGKADIPEIFRVLRQYGICPVMALEYEKDMYNPLLYLIPSVEAIERIVKTLK